MANNPEIGVHELHGGDCIITINIHMTRERREAFGIGHTEDTREFFEKRTQVESNKENQ